MGQEEKEEGVSGQGATAGAAGDGLPGLKQKGQNSAIPVNYTTLPGPLLLATHLGPTALPATLCCTRRTHATCQNVSA